MKNVEVERVADGHSDTGVPLQSERGSEAILTVLKLHKR